MTQRLLITCDRVGILRRAALWKGRYLRDVFVERLDRTDMTGALVRGRVVRTLAGGKAAWIDAGLEQRLYLENPRKPLSSGDVLDVRVRASVGEGKAWPCVVAEENGDGENRPPFSVSVGLIAPPPSAWQRAFAAAGAAPVAVRFAEREDHAAFCALSPQGEAVLSDKEPVHPDLDEIIESLLEPVVPLARGASLVIEPTSALVAIDVNKGDASSPLAVNLEAVAEAARQIRLRNLSGIIVIDCLKMSSRSDGAKVANAFARASADDPAGVYSGGMSKLGLLEATRARGGSPLAIVMSGARD